MTKEPTSTVKHCGYCSEGYDGKCDGVYFDTFAYAEGIIKRLEDKNAKLLSVLKELDGQDFLPPAYQDMIEICLQDSPTAL